MSKTGFDTALLMTFHPGLKKYYATLPSNNNLDNHSKESMLIFKLMLGELTIY